MRSLLFAILLSSSLAAYGQGPATISGRVTAVLPSGSFDIEGRHIQSTPTTEFRTHTGISSSIPLSNPSAIYLGENVEATGHFNHSANTLTASQVVVFPEKPARLRGVAIIDLIPPVPAAQPIADRTVRADGFLLHITAKTKLKFAPPLASLSDIATNQWIDYSGVQQLDGTVLLDYAGIGPNRVSHTESKLRTKSEYDPAAVPDDAHQSSLSRTFIGVDPHKVPPFHNDDMQARIERIGNSLVPAYQRALPDADPSKMNFRFQLIDATKLHDALGWSSGIILVPYQVVERLQNDDQLAAVLADNIAEAIEKDALRTYTTNNKIGDAQLAGIVAGIFLPGASIASELAGGGVAAHIHTLELQQSGRVSLCFLHDAGYDITQAPLAWWLLAPQKPKPIDNIKLPPRANTLYVALGTTWHPIAGPTAPATAAQPQ